MEFMKAQSLFVCRVEQKIWELYETGAIDEERHNEFINDIRAYETLYEKFDNLLQNKITANHNRSIKPNVQR